MALSNQILIIGGLIILSIAYQGIAIYIHNMHRKKTEKENPDLSIMVLKERNFHPLGFTYTLNCLSVNGEPKEQIIIGYGQRGHYLQPGKNILELQYETQRPGILHRWVRTTYDPQKIEVNVEPNKKYSIEYNKNTNEFLFKEIE